MAEGEGETGRAAGNPKTAHFASQKAAAAFEIKQGRPNGDIKFFSPAGAQRRRK